MLFSLYAAGWPCFVVWLFDLPYIYDNRRYENVQIRRRNDEQMRRDCEERSRHHEEILMEMRRGRKERRRNQEEMMREIRHRR